MRFVCRHHSVKHDLLCPMHLKLILQFLVLLNSFRHIASRRGVTTSGNFRNSIALLKFCYPVFLSFNKPLILANKEIYLRNCLLFQRCFLLFSVLFGLHSKSPYCTLSAYPFLLMPLKHIIFKLYLSIFLCDSFGPCGYQYFT